jgi:tRNA(Arg) A34 adenosine deaminase TadA
VKDDVRAQYLRLALEEGVRGARGGHGGPFGAVVVQGDRVVAAACNEVTSRNDPTAHAEMQAIRAACQALGTFRLDDCDVYSSCEPCPMCLAALYWAHPRAVFYGATRADAAAAGFDDALIYEELDKPATARSLQIQHLAIDGVARPFDVWRGIPGRVRY